MKDSSRYKVVMVDFSALKSIYLILACLIIMFFSGAIVSSIFIFSWGDFLSDIPWELQKFVGFLAAFVFVFYYFFPTILASNVNANWEDRGALSFLYDSTVGLFFKYSWAAIAIPFKYFFDRFVHGGTFSFSEHFERHFREIKRSSDQEKTLKDVFGTADRVQHPHVMWIFLLNLLLGSTVIFYIVALVWATNPKEVLVPLADAERDRPFRPFSDDEEVRDDESANRPFAAEQASEVEMVTESSGDSSGSVATSVEDVLALRLEKLQKLYDKGIVTDAEYQEQRRLIISEI